MDYKQEYNLICKETKAGIEYILKKDNKVIEKGVPPHELFNKYGRENILIQKEKSLGKLINDLFFEINKKTNQERVII